MTIESLMAATVDTGAVPQQHPLTVFVCDTISGSVVRRSVPYVGVPQWQAGVNLNGMVKVKVPLGVSPALTSAGIDELLDYWRLSWGVRWGAHILQCGPVIGDGFEDGPGSPSVDVSCVGLWGLLASKRLLLRGAWAGSNPAEEAADTTFGPTSPDVANQNLSLHSVARRLVEDHMTRPGCALPVDLPAVIAGSAERSYPGYDLASVGQRLYELTQVIDGPELEFRPYFTNDAMTTVRWEARIGTPANQARIGDLGQPWRWTYRKALTRLDVDHDGSMMTSESWVRGNGTERSLLTGYAYDPSLPAAGWPALVTANNDHSSASVQETLDDWAEADTTVGRRPARLLDGEIRMDGSDGQGRITAAPPVDQVRCGDTAVLRVRGHRRLVDGTYPVRILSMTQGATTDTVGVTFDRTEGDL